MDDVTGKIIGAAIEVHKYSGTGLLENIYETALCYEMNKLGANSSKTGYYGHSI